MDPGWLVAIAIILLSVVLLGLMMRSVMMKAGVHRKQNYNNVSRTVYTPRKSRGSLDPNGFWNNTRLPYPFSSL